MADFCTAWRKGVRTVWNVPADTHCYIFPLLYECLPVYDEVCRRSINFLRRCISHSCKVVRRVANYGIYHGRCDSPAGRKVLHCDCMRLYSATMTDVLSPKFESLLSASMSQDFLFTGNNRSICCTDALLFVTMFLLCLILYCGRYSVHCVLLCVRTLTIIFL